MEPTDGTTLRSGRRVGSLHEVQINEPVNGTNTPAMNAMHMEVNGQGEGLANGSIRPLDQGIESHGHDNDSSDDDDMDDEDWEDANESDTVGVIVKSIVDTIRESLSCVPQMIQGTIDHHMSDQNLPISNKPSANFEQVRQSVTQLPLCAVDNQPALNLGTEHVAQPVRTRLNRMNASAPKPSMSNEEVMPRKERRSQIKPPTFDGTTSWPDFLLQFEMASEYNGWTEREQLLCLGCSLTGIAQETLGDADEKARKSYDALVECLNEQFGPGKQVEVFKTLLWKRVQNTDETFPELAHSIRRLVKRTYPLAPPAMIASMSCDHFIEAITNEEVKKWVCYKEPATLDEAVRMAIKVESREDKGRGKRSVRFVHAKKPTPENGQSAEQRELILALKGIQKNMSGLADQVTVMQHTSKPRPYELPMSYNSGPMQNNQYQAPHASNQYQGPPRGGYNHYSGSQKGTYSKGQSTYTMNPNIVCFHCNERGHISRTCPHVNKPIPQAPTPVVQIPSQEN